MKVNDIKGKSKKLAGKKHLKNSNYNLILTEEQKKRIKDLKENLLPRNLMKKRKTKEKFLICSKMN